MQENPRYLSETDYRHFVPVHVVWEITLACDLKCMHCGSRAGKPRPGELSLEECLEVVDALAALGTREVTLIGGEAYLKKGWTEIIRRIADRGMYCATQTGGRNFTEQRLKEAVAAGLGGLGVSLDGLAVLHDRLRGVQGSFAQAIHTLWLARSAGLNISVNTQIGAEVIPQLPELMETLVREKVTQWQIQITVAMGNAVDHPDLLLQPFRVLELMPVLAELYQKGAERGLLLVMGNNIGYFGPYEHLWRGFGNERHHWTGCHAGLTSLALEADGTVKGCPSLATVGFAGGNVRELTLEQIWNTSPEIHFGRLRSVDDLWGFCRTCYYADTCRGGCTWTSHSLLGKPGNNPYCHYRALELKKQGLRERVVKVREAAPASFAVGEFQLITERIDTGAVVASSLSQAGLVHLGRPNPSGASVAPGRLPSLLMLCRACHCYVQPSEIACPHCGSDIQAALTQWQHDQQRRQALLAHLRDLLSRHSVPEAASA